MRGKDAEENKKHFDKCLDVIKAAGVSRLHSTISPLTEINLEESRRAEKHTFGRTFPTRMAEVLRDYCWRP